MTTSIRGFRAGQELLLCVFAGAVGNLMYPPDLKAIINGLAILWILFLNAQFAFKRKRGPILWLGRTFLFLFFFWL